MNRATPPATSTTPSGSFNASTVGYEYDSTGLANRLTLDGSPVAQYGVDDAGRLTTITHGSSTFSLAYDNASRRLSLSYPNGIVTSYSYDANSSLLGITSQRGGSPVQQISYTYDTVGNRTAKTVDSLLETYSYDPLSRLTGVARAGATPRRWSLAYDSVGNRLSGQADGITLSGDFDQNNQLLSLTPGGKVHILGEVDEAATVSVAGQPARMTGARTFEADVDVAPGTNSIPIVSTDGSGNSRTQVYEVEVGGDAATFEHDENGNTTQKVSGGHTWTYQWNALNQLTAVSKDGQPMATFKYDALGRRIEKVAGGVTYRFVYSGQDILREAQSSGATYTYIHGPGIDEPLARLDQAGATYYHADGLGSIVATTDAAGNVTSRRQYDAWGNLEVGADQPGYAFTGREWDPETGLYYYRARYYDPKIGRFISEDPIGFNGGLNFYAYGGNSPVRWVDPLGLDFIDTGGHIISMFEDFITGTGPEIRIFGPDSALTKDLMHAPGVDRARRRFCRRGATAVTDFDASFGLFKGTPWKPLGIQVVGQDGLFNLDSNLTRQFVGTYKVNILAGPGGRATFYVVDSKNMTSLLAQEFPWTWSHKWPGGTTEQVYYWTENCACQP